MKMILKNFAAVALLSLSLALTTGCGARKPYKMLVLTERGGQHGPFTDAGLKWLADQQVAMGFEMTEINSADSITEQYLAQFAVIVQLDFPPYTWSDTARAAFEKYIDEGHGGWVGFHHATLLGEFDGWPMWQWFSDFMGGIRFQNYIAALADGRVTVEAADHPVMRGVESTFVIPDDEWYTFDRSPRGNVEVLASVDEASYEPASDIRMGDHPVVWTNTAKGARNVYFLPGHTPQLFENSNFTTMFTNAIKWCAQ